MKKRRIVKIICGLMTILALGYLGMSAYFFHTAQVRSEKSFVSGGRLKPTDHLYAQQQAWLALPKKPVQLKTEDGLLLKGDYVPADQPTKKIAIVIHGFSVDHNANITYAQLMHEQGYNVVLADNRAAGRSQGRYIGFGYLEAKDYLAWIKQLIKQEGADSEIVVYGTSLGGATTMLLAGMQPPKQVKAFIEDCGYNDVRQELYYEANGMYHLPMWITRPMVETLSLYSRWLAGYSYDQVRPTEALKHNRRPILFIHGSEDKFVPTAMIHDVYRANRGPKEQYIAKSAGHMDAYQVDPQKYEAVVSHFLHRYVP
ncbi:alpha/beta hydrolase [Weissella halotolerans]|nr:alpha/beta hydrolase [Weissella halotolerans]